MSFTFANLPGVQIATIDGGLAAVNTPTTQSILVFGTSAIGPANSPFQVVSLAQAAKTFGLNGTLIRGMSEVAAYCDNVSLFRIGTAQGTFTVGNTGTGTPAIGTVAYAFSNAAGTLYTYGVNLGTDLATPSAVIPPDVTVGALITTVGFTNAAFNITSKAVTSVDPIHNRITVAITPGVVPGGGLESFALSGNSSITANLATVRCTQAVTQVLSVGDSVTIASATSSVLNGTYTLLSAVLAAGVWTVTFTSGTTTLAPTAQVAGTIVDNGAIAATVNGTGTIAVATNAGSVITLGQVDATANTRYKIWYNDSLLTLWLDNAVVYSNDPAINVNTGDSSVALGAVGGMAINAGVAGNPDTLANAITLSAAVALVPVAPDLVPVYVAPTTGIGLTGRALYIAQQNAMNLIQGFPIDYAVVPGAMADQPNVAFYVASNSSTVINNPVTNSSALDWLWTGVDVNGNPIYQWATETQFYTWNNLTVSSATLQGQSVTTTPITNTFTSATTRLAQGVGSGNLQQNGFHEVNFAYQLSRFCAAQSAAPQASNGGCFGFIGTQGPANLSNFSLTAVKTWIGYLPVYDPISGHATVSGSGLLGIPFLVGCTASALNQACADFANGFRVPGLFATVSNEYDGGGLVDANGFSVDNGAYIAVQGDYALQSNGFGTYVGNIAGVVAGLTSTLDQLRATTNKQVAGVSQLYRASLNQLDALTFADINVLRYKGPGQLPVVLHDKTAAAVVSDYTLTLRQRIKFLMIQVLLKEAQQFIGNGTTASLSLVALKTALDADCLNLQKRGYISSYNFTITSTKAQQKIGQASIQISFVPANELVQLNATIGINLNQ